MSFRRHFKLLASALLIAALIALQGIALAQDDVLTIPPDVTTIQDEAFYGDTSLDAVILPDGITSIGARAFAGSGLTKINLPSSLTAIDATAFDGPDYVTVTAEKGTWAYTWAVENGYIVEPTPESDFETDYLDDGTLMIVRYLGDSAKVVVPATIDGVPVTKIHNAFIGIDSIESVVVSEGITWIGEEAFAHCTSLSKVTLPNSLERIGARAFDGDRSLHKIHLPSGLTSIGIADGWGGVNRMVNIFTEPYDEDDEPYDITVTAEEGTYAYKWAEYYGYIKSSASHLKVTPFGSVGEVVTENGVTVWKNLPSVWDLYLQFTVLAPGEWSAQWDEDSYIFSVDDMEESYPASVHCLQGYMNLNDTGEVLETEVTFTSGDESVTIILRQNPTPEAPKLLEPEDIAIYSDAMAEGEEDGVSLEYHQLPLELTWSRPEHLTEVTQVYNLEAGSYDEVTAKYNGLTGETFTTVIDPSTLDLDQIEEDRGKIFLMLEYTVDGARFTSQPYWIAFEVSEEPEEFETDVLDDGTLMIVHYGGDDADVVIPNEIDGVPVTGINEWSFNYKYGIESVVIPEGIKWIGGSAFASCESLSSVTLPESLESIGPRAFDGDRSLHEIHLPSGLTSIGTTDEFGGINRMFNIFTEPDEEDDEPYDITVTADEGTYAYKWAVHYGYIQSAASHLTVTPFGGVGEVVTENGVTVWKDIPGGDEVYLQFTVMAPGDWSAQWDEDQYIFGVDEMEESYPASVHNMQGYVIGNDTGEAREVEVTFTSGDESVTIVLRQNAES